MRKFSMLIISVSVKIKFVIRMFIGQLLEGNKTAP